MLIQVTPRLVIDDGDLRETFMAASGPGGQNVNKVATSVQLRFDLASCATLAAGVKLRLAALAGRRLTQDGEIVITANRHRTQIRNREDARDRLLALIRAAAIAPAFRRPTRPTLASDTRRLDAKNRKSSLKKLRRIKGDD